MLPRSWGYYHDHGAITTIMGLLPRSWGYYHDHGAITTIMGLSKQKEYIYIRHY